MKSKKIGIIISFVLVTISVLLVVMSLFIETTASKNLLNSLGMGILGSAVVTFAISFGEYRVERKRALKNFIHEVDKIIVEFRKLPYISDSKEHKLILNYRRERQHNKTQEMFGLKADENNAYLELFNHYKNVEPDYTDEQIDALVRARYKVAVEYIVKALKLYSEFSGISLESLSFSFDEFDFFFANKTLLERINKDIYAPIVSMVREIKVETYHFDLYLDEEKTGGNLAVCYDKLISLNEKLFRVETSIADKFEPKTVYESFADELDDKVQMLYSEQVNKKADKMIEHIPKSSYLVSKMFD